MFTVQHTWKSYGFSLRAGPLPESWCWHEANIAACKWTPHTIRVKDEFEESKLDPWRMEMKYSTNPKKVNFSWNCIENLSHFHCYYFSEEACVSIECSLRSVLHISRNSTLSSANMCVIHPPMCVIQLPIRVPVVIVCQNVDQFLGNSSVLSFKASSAFLPLRVGSWLVNDELDFENIFFMNKVQPSKPGG